MQGQNKNQPAGNGQGSCGACDTSTIRERMEVVGSCGNTLGTVDHIEGEQIKLTKQDSPDGKHHFIPANWVESVDDKVHLSRDCGEAKREWTAA